MSDHTLPRSERLRSLKAIRRLFGEGHSGFVYPVRYVYLLEQPGVEQGAEEQLSAVGVEAPASERAVQAMFSVPKKFHKRANRRNLHKRRMREAYRLGRETMCERLSNSRKHLQIAFIYSTKESHSYKTVSNAVQRILEQVSKAV